MSTSTLFLDFDGVLHSMSGYHDQSFCRLPLLEEVLVDADVDIVISSGWRFQYSLDELKDKLGQLGSKVVGTTGEAGFAWVYRQYVKNIPKPIAKAFLDAEASAKASKAGLWADKDPIVQHAEILATHALKRKPWCSF